MRLLLLMLSALFALLFAGGSLLAETPDDTLTMGQRLEQYGKLEEQILPLFTQKQYEKAADLCRKQMQLVPESSEPHYNLACASARLGQKESAMLELRQAADLGYTDVAHMREDEDLASLHDDDKFKELLKTIREKQLNAPHEMPAPIDGVKTIENFPEGGLRYRLRIDPAANAKKPARLLIWLHPSGGSMDNVVEQMSPQFAKDGFAVLVFTQKNFDFWSPEDLNALFEKTIPDVAKIEGVDAKKPVLIGYSAGGQLALDMWDHNPGGFGGLVVDAAYPLDPQKYAQGKLVPMEPPKNDAIKSCPILALVGGADGGSKVWEQVDKAWHDARIPLTVHIIPGKGHQWLFGDDEQASLHDWLKSVAAGELPTDTKPLKRPLGEQDNNPIKVIFTP